MGSHSRFAPSATEREFLCPPSFLLNEQLPDRNTTDSAHGTAAHHLGELCLKTDHDTSLYAGCLIAVDPHGECRFVHENAPLLDTEQGFEVDDEMVNAVQSYLDWCREVPGDHFVEIRVEHTPWCPDEDEWGDPLGAQYGTSDHIACQPGVLTVTDLKYGKGVKVYAERNKQAIKYALGAWEEYDWIYGFKKIVVRIAQPRLDHYDTWETTVEEALALGKEIKIKLADVFDPLADFNPGEKQCRFCKASARCKAKHDYVHSTIRFENEDVFLSPSLMTPEELAEAWKRWPMFQQHYDAIRAEVLETLKAGVELPDLKLVNAVTHRRWKDRQAAKETLLNLGVSPDAIETRMLVSPNQAEKLLTRDKHAVLEALWEKPPGGPTVALASDKREAYTGHTNVEGFEDLDDGL
jgi:hypothetical protein